MRSAQGWRILAKGLFVYLIFRQGRALAQLNYSVPGIAGLGGFGCVRFFRANILLLSPCSTHWSKMFGGLAQHLVRGDSRNSCRPRNVP